MDQFFQVRYPEDSVMRRSSKRSLLVVFAVFVLIWWWLSQLKISAPSLLFAILQSALIAVVVLMLRKGGADGLVGYALSSASGWLASFFISLCLESIFSPSFDLSMQQMASAGSLNHQMVGWFISSLSYLGVVQGPSYFLAFRPAKGK